MIVGAPSVPPVVRWLAHKERRALNVGPTTEPRFQSCLAPNARSYHSTARTASGTASMTEMIVGCGDDINQICPRAGGAAESAAHNQVFRTAYSSPTVPLFS